MLQQQSNVSLYESADGWTPSQIAMIDAAMLDRFPLIDGWQRDIKRGGVLCSASVTYTREVDAVGCLLCAFVHINKADLSDVTMNLCGWIAKRDPVDGRFYSEREDHFNVASVPFAIDVMRRKLGAAGSTIDPGALMALTRTRHARIRVVPHVGRASA